MTHQSSETVQDLARHRRYLIATAARAPSVHNTQPWRFTVHPADVELWCDPGRKLRVDPAGREMLISCGAALFGLRLAIRSLGYVPAVELLPDPARLRLLAKVRVSAVAPVSAWDRSLMAAVPHRHTHRGPFAAGPVPAGLLAGLQHDALAERATLEFVDSGHAYQRLARIVTAAARHGDLDPRARADVRDWTRATGSGARDGVPALAFSDREQSGTGALAQRDFDLRRGIAGLPGGAERPPVTAVLLTAGDRRADWLRAGQALYRLLLRAAASWVFASLHSQPLEYTATRQLIRDRLALPGYPQVLLQLGNAVTTAATARRPPAELAGP